MGRAEADPEYRVMYARVVKTMVRSHKKRRDMVYVVILAGWDMGMRTRKGRSNGGV